MKALPATPPTQSSDRESAVPRALRELRPELRPRLRGVLHQWAFVGAIPLGVALVLAASGANQTIACAVYAVSIAALFGVSAIYHRVTWRSPQTRERMRRVDHSMIFLLIAGSYTPIAIIAIGETFGTAILATVWSGAAIGVAVRIMWSDAPRWATTGPYIALGWVAVAAFPPLLGSIGVVGVALLALGGALYTIGGVIYAKRAPNPIPGVFGYHEIFHALVIVAALVQYAVVALWVLPA